MGAPVRPGDVLAGKYRVERVLGEGGMGVVVAARHLQLDQLVALKFLLPEAVANPEALSRFEREARNAVRLKSEHVARIIDVGTLDGGAPYIVMEFLQGSDLAGVLAQHGVLPVAVAVDFILQACDAIGEAHALGIVHRDLKPQNLFVTRRHDNTSIVKVLDFGISKSTAVGDFAATRTQAVMGSPAYMSPEQMRSAKLVDVRTDIWALGIILHELVLGRVPWHAETFTELCFKVAMDPLPPFPTVSALPAGFAEVVRRCLEKDPAQRFPDVYALAVALMPFAPPHVQPLVEQIGRVVRGQAGMSAVMQTVMATGPGTLPEATGQRVTKTATGSRKRTIAGLVGAVVVVAGIAVTAAVMGGGQRGESDGKPAPAVTDHAAGQPVPVSSAPASASPPAVAQPAPVSPPPASAPAPVNPPPAVTPAEPASAPPTAPPVAHGADAAPATKAAPQPPAATAPGQPPSAATAASKSPKKDRGHSTTRPTTAPSQQPADILNSPD